MFTVTVTNRDKYPELSLDALFCVEAVNFSTVPVVGQKEGSEDENEVEFKFHQFSCVDPDGGKYSWPLTGSTVIRVMNSAGKMVAEFSNSSN
ncbi:hypothetical protein [Vibrio phage JSF12]|uniref:Uncharacterized protein n=3 Tax=Jesfedecavirus TaxID=2560156 RepID=A0A2D0YLN8_9CAUD|nr:hypothetical protein AVV29_gp144 [Vibrio phage phi 3]YP_009618423.1 hypothetical protein FDI98_gp136 [Vibrio phage JSF10]YP_009794716.1 hypothetical protein HOS35_gp033 [Vibrio phage JSF12]AJF40834.1 hypothetical protein SBVP3_0067 [Vibrio phage phi 3]ASV43396.1 hypothetical protein [Vibrio phage JSF10]ASV43551.1 hypothetical protein [Vibrio phage JSF12]